VRPEVEEILKTSTQVVQAPLSIRRFYEPIFGTFAVTGEMHITVQPVTKRQFC
jgi:hypothetical protein